MGKAISDLKYLVVEDNPATVELISAMLHDLGATQVFTVGNGEAARDFLANAENVVDVVICDWLMPRMTGLEFLRQVRRTHPELPFIMVTAMADIKSVKAAQKFGVSAYLTKPFQLDDLEGKLKAVAEAA